MGSMLLIKLGSLGVWLLYFKNNMSKLKKDLELSDFPVYNYVKWTDCERIMGPRMYKKFSEWMGGQTCVKNGVYPWDLERFLKGLPVID